MWFYLLYTVINLDAAEAIHVLVMHACTSLTTVIVYSTLEATCLLLLPLSSTLHLASPELHLHFSITSKT